MSGETLDMTRYGGEITNRIILEQVFKQRTTPKSIEVVMCKKSVKINKLACTVLPNVVRIVPRRTEKRKHLLPVEPDVPVEGVMKGVTFAPASLWNCLQIENRGDYPPAAFEKEEIDVVGIRVMGKNVTTMRNKVESFLRIITPAEPIPQGIPDSDAKPFPQEGVSYSEAKKFEMESELPPEMPGRLEPFIEPFEELPDNISLGEELNDDIWGTLLSMKVASSDGINIDMGSDVDTDADGDIVFTNIRTAGPPEIELVNKYIKLKF